MKLADVDRAPKHEGRASFIFLAKPDKFYSITALTRYSVDHVNVFITKYLLTQTFVRKLNILKYIHKYIKKHSCLYIK